MVYNSLDMDVATLFWSAPAITRIEKAIRSRRDEKTIAPKVKNNLKKKTLKSLRSTK